MRLSVRLRKISDPDDKTARLHAEIARRYAWNKKQRRLANPLRFMTFVRQDELERIFMDRYGLYLPDDDAGWDDLIIMAHHLAHLGGAPDKVVTRIVEWAAMWAPTFPADKIAERAELVAARPVKFKANTLAWRLRLTMEQRTRLKITSIGAVDVPKDDRPAYLREHHRQRKETVRRANGVKPRAEYLAGSISAQKPWEALSMSKATWYRRGKPEPCETGLSRSPRETGPSQPVRQVWQTRKKERQRSAALVSPTTTAGGFDTLVMPSHAKGLTTVRHPTADVGSQLIGQQSTIMGRWVLPKSPLLTRMAELERQLQAAPWLERLRAFQAANVVRFVAPPHVRLQWPTITTTNRRTA